MSVSPTQTGILTAAPGEWSLGGQHFDAWLRLFHNSGLTITQHPVAKGAQISDHCYVNAKRFSFDIGMSDVISPYPQDRSGAIARSIQAYNDIVALQESRTFLTLVSKYGTYQNILIENIDAQDDARTVTGTRWTVNLYRPIVVDTNTFQATSNNPQATVQTSRGIQNPQPLSPSEQRSFQAYVPGIINSVIGGVIGGLL